MVPARIRIAGLAGTLGAIMGIAAYHVSDERSLERDFKQISRQKVVEVVDAIPAKWQVYAEWSNNVHRGIPFFGTPSAEIAMTLDVRGPSGTLATQNFDFYFSRKNARWTEITCAEDNHAADNGGISVPQSHNENQSHAH
ncbi:MAG: hypothetical protein HUU46_02895 [Candidatus Hydrogenedentes bacterium]|nr:hypothetical protein [Candidatus Hydrogenedentota bacterium]